MFADWSTLETSNLHFLGRKIKSIAPNQYDGFPQMKMKVHHIDVHVTQKNDLSNESAQSTLRQ